MDINKTVTILEALVSGCSPATGELLDSESVLNERDVIRALQIAIDQLKLKEDTPPRHANVEIEEAEISTVIRLFQEHNILPTYSRLAGFFLASRSLKNDFISAHKLYGKYKNLYKKGQLLDFFTTYLSDNGYSKHGKRMREKEPWEDIDFFQKEVFNNLSEEAIDQLKEKINELGVTQTENLSDYVRKARLNYPRSHEPWTDVERQLLRSALQETNDLELLSGCFQRGHNAIELRGRQLIYQDQTNNTHP